MFNVWRGSNRLHLAQIKHQQGSDHPLMTNNVITTGITIRLN
ncbi:hypothetical protein BN439_1788 [Erwinia amylovora Ea644]|nr:hypothetical protein BN439_1788 [Erwinia amylovora Ea644]CCP06881.1 hypothetical protein BN440_1854 [Erwinia amylovora MR1]